jgi:siroheme synthase
MGAGEGPAIAAALIAAGKPASTPVAVVESASLEEARVFHGTLEQLPRLTGGPVLILVGEVYRDAREDSGEAADVTGAQRDAIKAGFG